MFTYHEKTSVKKTTLRYAAKQAYQLFLMTGKNSCAVAGLWCHVVTDNTLYGGTVVLVYSHEGTPDNPSKLLLSANPPKSWINL